jgi:hypothetical protein
MIMVELVMTIAKQTKRNENPEQRMVPVRNLEFFEFILWVTFGFSKIPLEER